MEFSKQKLLGVEIFSCGFAATDGSFITMRTVKAYRIMANSMAHHLRSYQPEYLQLKYTIMRSSRVNLGVSYIKIPT